MKNILDPLALNQANILEKQCARAKITWLFRLFVTIFLGTVLWASIYFPYPVGMALFALTILNYWLLLSFRISNLEKPLNWPPQASVPTPFKTISMLLPLKYEGEIVGGTIQAIRDLDYPEENKELLIIVEENDHFTQGHLKNMVIPAFAQIVLIPAGYPSTKGRALLYGLQKASGELITVFDAESRPDADQLYKANQFFAPPGDLKCCQAKVRIANKDQNWMTRNFAAEYYEWYDQYLPELSMKQLAFGLGGNSFYLYKHVLEKCGSWDPFNVTEDADLSVRLINYGVQLNILNSYTWENCPDTPVNWIKQRTRWNKGLLITQLVHLFPTLFNGHFNWSSWLSFWLRMVAGTLLPFGNLFLLLFLIIAEIPPRLTWYASIGLWSLFALSLIIMTLMNFITFRRLKIQRDLFSLFFGLLAYTVLHIIAGFNAWIQFLVKPLKWNKTLH